MAVPQYTTVADVLARLRLATDTPDAGFVALCVQAANERVDQWLDRTDPTDTVWPPLAAPYPAEVTAAATNAAIHVYRYKDAVSDIADAFGVEQPRLTSDPLGGQRHLLAAYRHPRGFTPA